MEREERVPEGRRGVLRAASGATAVVMVVVMMEMMVMMMTTIMMMMKPISRAVRGGARKGCCLALVAGVGTNWRTRRKRGTYVRTRKDVVHARCCCSAPGQMELPQEEAAGGLELRGASPPCFGIQ